MKRILPQPTGFTLIEILVVIAIVAVLAAVILVAINPAERIKEAQDRQEQSAASDIADSFDRLLLIHSNEAWPWQPYADGGIGCNGGNPPVAAAADSNPWRICLGVIAQYTEAKGYLTSYTSGMYNYLVESDQVKQMYFTYQASTDSLWVCFQPQSKSVQHSPEAKYHNDLTACDNTTEICSVCHST